ncbi:MAG TPA: hypothetical protein VHE11_02165 [Steroidobacteraceae bacterium]|nr:hypothetical protein [Steroidobacteraceae bacterium]
MPAGSSRNGGGAVIGGFGMVASLGYDGATVCAAARAGLVRPAVQPGFRIRSDVEGDEEPVIAHQATLLTRGFEGRARLIRLAQGALEDLRVRTPHIDWQATPHRLYVALPDPARIDRGEALMADAEARASVAARLAQRQSSEPAGAAVPVAIADPIVRKAAMLARWPAEPVIAFASLASRTGALRAVQAAIADLTAGACGLAVILALDSLLDESTLHWLHSCGRLKCDGTPAGLQPGEAAVALALLGGGGNLPNGRSIRVGPVDFADEARSFFAGTPPAGEGLAEVIGRAWPGPDDATPWILPDQNGEYYRAADWGFALVRLRARSAAFAAPVLWFPAASVGDTGAAAPLVAACFAAQAWERGYAPARAALITACDDEAGRSALALLDTGSAGAS